jgi:hypothetical protein
MVAALSLSPGGGARNYEEYFESTLERMGVEPPQEMLRAQLARSSRAGAETPSELAAGVRQKARLAEQNRVAPIPGTGGEWTPLGKTPLQFAEPYPAAFGDGYGRVNGRVNDLAVNENTDAVYAAVAQGGVWMIDDLGKPWRPIGDNLPIGSTGSIAWTRSGGPEGTLVVATGDHAFSNDYAGVGVFWSTDDGAHWTRASGVPNGALSFRLRVDPSHPEVIYYASGLGLFRSTDSGRSFTNLQLPTGDCTGDSYKPNCFFANMVTDVAVQPKDEFGHDGGAVLAAIGWRAGQRPNFNNKPEGVGNGLYKSPDGSPGSFKKLTDVGFTPPERQGRVEFGVADGEGQNGAYVYAIAQDSELFNKQTGGEADIPLVGTPSVLDAIYVSGDFGDSWAVMQSREEFLNAANQSTLSQLAPLGIGPGYQVTYNQAIEVDPTRQLNGIPTRVILQMEEVWQTYPPHAPQSGHSQFAVIGSYAANGGACLVVPEACGAAQRPKPQDTTTHPDQHAALISPTGEDGITLFVGNDGGVYSQTVNRTVGEFNRTGWGQGTNEGFHTLLPYGVAMAKDGTVFAGLQDNGQLKITPAGDQFATYVGDGTMALVEPDDSKVAYGALPNAGTYVTKDGGVTWTSIDPGLTDADFVAPLVMDPLDPKHIVTAGREIAETKAGPDTTSDTWAKVFNLGTHDHPGDESAGATAADPNNHATSLHVIGPDMYAGFCGGCDPVKLKQIFNNGLATNVGGKWHVAAARGLPNRTITNVAMDPADHRTVYVTLGVSAMRYWAPIGSQGEDASRSAGGHVYKSTDAGESFTDITGDLPKVQTTWVIPRGGQLVVATGVGVFMSKDSSGGHWAPLGNSLPPTAVYSMQLKPGDDGTLIAATYGRGVYQYRFADPADTGVIGGCTDVTRPTLKLARPSLKRRKLRLKGTASDLACAVKVKPRRVEVAVARLKGKRCRFVAKTGRVARKARSCRKPVWLKAKGTSRWTFSARRRLAKGRYRVYVRAVDAAGLVSRAARSSVR